MTGNDVLAWELFLRGQGFYWVEADGVFDDETKESTKSWQNSLGLQADGEVDIASYGAAQRKGFNPGFTDESTDEDGPNWPPKPSFGPLSSSERDQLFGSLKYKPAPFPGNPEAITLLDDWATRNIVQLNLPDAFKPIVWKAPFHTKCAAQIEQFFQAVDNEGLATLIINWGGSWAPRFVRGSRTVLSNHAYGTAFDINVAWNGLGVVPALRHKKGSVRELVSIANNFGLYWGGHFSRPDGMHFEVAQLLDL